MKRLLFGGGIAACAFESCAAQSPGASVTAAHGIVLLVFFASAYFAPTIIAVLRKHPRAVPIAVLNTLLGWTVLGWIGSLIWSLMSPAPTTIVIHTPPGPPTS